MIYVHQVPHHDAADRLGKVVAAAADPRTTADPAATATSSPRWPRCATCCERRRMRDTRPRSVASLVHYAVEPMATGDALELDVTAVGERHVGRPACHEVAHRARDEHLAADGLGRDARRVVHGRAIELIRVLQRVTRVDADPEPDRRAPASASASARSRAGSPVRTRRHAGRSRRRASTRLPGSRPRSPRGRLAASRITEWWRRTMSIQVLGHRGGRAARSTRRCR